MMTNMKNLLPSSLNVKQYNSHAQAPCHEKVCKEAEGKSKIL